MRPAMGRGTARIELAFGDGALELTVTNPMPPNGEPRSGGGHGLTGMRERATLLGGSLDAGRADGGGVSDACANSLRGHRS